MHQYFSQHPQIFVSHVKEPHFFACPEVEDTYYDTEFVSEEARYLSLFNDRDASQFAIDCSPSYMFSEYAASRVYEKRPDAKILIILRDPVERAISHYLMDHRTGYISASMIECLKAPEEYQAFYQEYVDMGRYIPQVQRWYQHFGKEQVAVFVFEELRKNTDSTVRSMFEFLSVDVDADIDFAGQENSHSTHRLAILDRLAMSPLWSEMRKWVPHAVLEALRSMFWDRSRADFSAEREWLKQTFADDIEPLQKLIDRDLSAWRD